MAVLSQRRSRLVARLGRRKSREREGLVLVEGVRAAREALDAGAEVRFAVTSPRLEAVPAGGELRARMASAGVEVTEVPDAELARLSDTEHAQGVLLVCREPAAGLDALRAGGRYLVLDAVQDPGNVGTLVRAAAAFGADGVVALDGTADPWGAKAVRASAGTVFRLPVSRAGAGEALETFAGSGVPVLLADPCGQDVRGLARTEGGFALVLANEGAGPRERVRASADLRVAVPMAGPVESLNVAVAGSLLLYLLTAGAARGA